jgi:hypothetical protein
MKIARLLLVFALAGCAEEPVEFLVSWRGKDEAWVVAKLGLPTSHRELTQPLPNIGISEGMQARLQEEYPGYVAVVRELRWKDGKRNFRALLVDSQGRWVILDALRWNEGIEF